MKSILSVTITESKITKTFVVKCEHRFLKRFDNISAAKNWCESMRYSVERIIKGRI